MLLMPWSDTWMPGSRSPCMAHTCVRYRASAANTMTSRVSFPVESYVTRIVMTDSTRLSLSEKKVR
jgi:hypothetical protein